MPSSRKSGPPPPPGPPPDGLGIPEPGSRPPRKDGTPWTRFEYPESGETIWQRECPDCDKGLLLAPVRFCPRCEGSGYLTTDVEPLAPNSEAGNTNTSPESAE